MTSMPFQHQLLSAARNLHAASWQISHKDLPLSSDAPWSIRKFTLHGGKQEGVDVIFVNLAAPCPTVR